MAKPDKPSKSAKSTSDIQQQLNEKAKASDLPEDEQAHEALEHPDYASLEEELTKTEMQINEYRNQVMRAQAELENVRKRAERDVSNAHKFALEKFVEELLPAIDSLEKSMEAAVGDQHQEGVELTCGMLLKAMEKFGVEQLNPLGEEFNPEYHEAISMQPDPQSKTDTVLKVLQKGYLLNGRLVRPAMVIVAQ